MERDLYKKILIATDGSENGAQAINAGMEIARLSQGKVYALYVIDNTCYPAERSDPRWKTAMEEQFKTFGLELTAMVEEAAKVAGVDVEFVTREGHPAEKILDFAEKKSVDMIVVGSLGKTDVERFLLGSVSEKVVRNAKVPVLVVHGKRN
ncbi:MULTISPECIES: universal stress protein [Methanosarcina]|uniref:Universal stress protein n=1 Tax=Methanosarcina mazei TaxID=2209 RepID=A0A0F8I2H6_METMZ|nr:MULTISPECIES: universal stress protein [Methanosarcina]KKG31090.1 universal stress protein [Methanosarcina mazei]KKG34331.1 universal stress protein [Methanosarcina mazei]KKG56624.1 universal stress protein [Methanosarcina mazei]KKG59206.1 universal stress protein [Methanosarcina mazei]KKG64626.1 universal stress protein [Methanosarcina mazei]